MIQQREGIPLTAQTLTLVESRLKTLTHCSTASCPWALHCSSYGRIRERGGPRSPSLRRLPPCPALPHLPRHTMQDRQRRHGCLILQKPWRSFKVVSEWGEANRSKGVRRALRKHSAINASLYDLPNKPFALSFSSSCSSPASTDPFPTPSTPPASYSTLSLFCDVDCAVEAPWMRATLAFVGQGRTGMPLQDALATQTGAAHAEWRSRS